MKWTHCKYGHELSGNNVYNVPGSNRRQCRVCRVNRGRFRSQSCQGQRKRLSQVEALIALPRTGRFTAEEDAIAIRDDITLIEKSFLLQRKPSSVKARIYRLHHPDQIEDRSAHSRLYWLANRERLLQQKRDEYARNREQISANNLAYYHANRDVILERRNRSYRDRRGAAIA